tara:strand:+ start:858 stop:1100 length:243 start_codon:yes stop_codon:yes gene_type:complete
MFDNNLIFSLVLSFINTAIFIALTHKENFDQKKQEYIMLFGITFVCSFTLKMLLNSNVMKGGAPTNIPADIMSKSSRPPF